MTKNRRRHTPDQIIRKLAEGNRLLAAGQELDEVSASGDDAVDVAPLGRPVRRHEGQRCEAIEGARGRERPVEEAAGRGRAGQQVDAQGDR